MKDRILAFLQNENKSYAQFAEEIGVQPSGISHILSGRNNPSLDFVIKMLHRYSNLSAEWLLFGRGSMYKLVSQPSLFENEMPETVSEAGSGGDGPIDWNEVRDAAESPEKASEATAMTGPGGNDSVKRLTKVLFFYSDKTFSEYMPA